MKNGRFFNSYNEESFRQLIEKVGGFKMLEMFKTTDVRPGREDEYWLNILMKKI